MGIAALSIRLLDDVLWRLSSSHLLSRLCRFQRFHGNQRPETGNNPYNRHRQHVRSQLPGIWTGNFPVGDDYSDQIPSPLSRACCSAMRKRRFIAAE